MKIETQSPDSVWVAQFSAGSCPAEDELEGDYEGDWLWSGLEPRWHAWLRAVWLKIWRGKRFMRPGRGCNLWLGLPVLPFETRVEASWLDGLDCLVIDYKNVLPGPWRDELRATGPGEYLGLMISGDKNSRRSFFSLRRRP